MTGKIEVMPLSRWGALIDLLARGVSARSGKVAQDYLVDELEHEWERLESFGLPAAEIEHHIRSLGMAVRIRRAALSNFQAGEQA